MSRSKSNFLHIKFTGGSSSQKNYGEGYKSYSRSVSQIFFMVFLILFQLLAIGAASQPSGQPSGQPTSWPTSNYNLSVTITQVQSYRLRAVVNILVNTDEGAFVYCGAFGSETTVSVQAIRQQSNFLFTQSGLVALNLTGLVAATQYSAYCFANTAQGHETSLSEVLQTRTPLITQCCRELRVSLLVHSTPAGPAVYNSVTAVASSQPEDSLMVEFSFLPTPAGNVSQAEVEAIAYPAVLQWGGAGIGGLDSVGANLQNVAIVPGGSGAQVVQATLSGTSAPLYSVVYTGSKKLVVLADETVPPVPDFLQAIISNDGTAVTCTFDYLTDKGGFANTFPCAQLLSFPGAAVATCQWSDPATILIYPKYTSTTPGNNLAVGGNVTLRANTIRAQCVDIPLEECHTWTTVPATVRSIYPPVAPVLPTVVIAAPGMLDACSPLVVDLTSSPGSAGRPWSRVTFSVRTTLGLNAQSAQLQNFLNLNYTLSPPTRIPTTAFAKGFTYSIQATLCNFLTSCASAVTTVTVSSSQALVPLVTLLGAAQRTTTRSVEVSVTANAFTQPCAGPASSANLQYTWVVNRLQGTARTPTSLKSASQNPTVFKLPAFSLDVGATYEVHVTVTTLLQPLPQSASTSVKVTVTPGSVVAVLQGGVQQYLKVDDLLTLDASKSYDQDVQGKTGVAAGLAMKWDCTLVSPTFSDVCALTVSETDAGILYVASTFVALNTTSLIKLTVSSGSRTSSAQVRVTVADVSRPKLAISSNLASLANINTGKAVALLGSAKIIASCDAAWSVDDPSLVLSNLCTTSVRKTLSPSTAAVPFNLVLKPGALPQRATLVFTLSCGGTSTSLAITTNGAPLPGEFVVSPTSGSELSTMFSFGAVQWSDPDLPLTYQFGFVSESSLSNLVIVSKSELAYTYTTLPAGLESNANMRTCTLDVYDSMEATVRTTAAVNVLAITPAQKEAMLLQLVQSNTGSVDSTKNILSVASTALNAVNCSSAPHCAPLHRVGCLKTVGTCGACQAGYIGDAGDRNTLCIPAEAAIDVGAACSYASSSGSSSGSATSTCPAYQTCVEGGVCATARKACAKGCSGHGECIYTDMLSGAMLKSCRLSDVHCNAVCSCESQYSGEFCELNDVTLQVQRAVRSNLIMSLDNLTRIDDINVESVRGWSASLYSLSIQPHQLSESDVQTVAAIANTTLQHAIALKGSSYEEMLGVLQATDTVASLLKYNYNPNDYTDRDFNVSRGLINNTAADTVHTVSAFADLVAQTMVLGQNTSSFLYENFRMSVSLTEMSTTDETFASPQDASDQALGTVTTTALLTPAEDAAARPPTVAVKLVSVPPRAYRPDTAVFDATPLLLQVQALTPAQSQTQTQEQDDENVASPATYLSSIEFAFQNNERIQKYVSYDVKNFTTTCDRSNAYQNFTYVCAESGQVIVHDCTAPGQHVSFCKVPAPACAKLDVNSAEYAFLDACTVVAYNATFTTCACTLAHSAGRKLVVTAEESLLDESGATCLMTSTVYIASGFTDTFKASGSFTSTADAEQVVVVIVLIGFIWTVGLLVIFYEGFVGADGKKKSSSAQVTPNVELRQQQTVLHYVESVIPKVFRVQGTTMQRIWGEILEHHVLFEMIAPRSVAERREMISKAMTMFTFTLFLIAIFFGVSNPGDDGSCTPLTSEDSCLHRVSPFDSTQNFCSWNADADTAACSYNAQSLTITALFYLTVLTTVLTSIATIPLDYLFSILSAPTVKSLEDSKVHSMYNAVRLGVRRVSNVGTNRIHPANPTRPAALGPTNPSPSNSRWSVIPFLASGTNDATVIANREISEEIALIGEEARGSIQLVSQNNQTLVLRSRLTRKILADQSEKRLIRSQTANSSGLTRSDWDEQEQERERDGAMENRTPEAVTAVTALSARGESVRSPSATTLCADVLQLRLFMNEGAEETRLFDAQWGVRRNGATASKAPFKFTAEASAAIDEACRSAENEAATLSANLPHYSVKHAGLEILHLFMIDLLGRNTPAARIFKEKFSEEFEDSRAVHMWHKYLAGAILLGLNAFFIYYILLKSFVQGYDWQIKFLICFLLQFFVDLLIFETTECVWLNFSVPSFVRRDVEAAIAKLRAQVDRVTLVPEEFVQAEHLRAVQHYIDAPTHLFVSIKVAKFHPQLLESMIVGCYANHLPGEICKTWPHYQPFLRAAEQQEEYHDTLGTWRFVRPILTGLSLSLQLFITVPFMYQRVAIRFVQPMMFSAVSLLWFFAVHNPVAIGAVSGVFILIIFYVLWQRYEALREEGEEQEFELPVAAPHQRDDHAQPAFISYDADLESLGNSHMSKNSQHSKNSIPSVNLANNSLRLRLQSSLSTGSQQSTESDADEEEEKLSSRPQATHTHKHKHKSAGRTRSNGHSHSPSPSPKHGRGELHKPVHRPRAVNVQSSIDSSDLVSQHSHAHSVLDNNNNDDDNHNNYSGRHGDLASSLDAPSPRQRHSNASANTHSKKMVVPVAVPVAKLVPVSVQKYSPKFSHNPRSSPGSNNPMSIPRQTDHQADIDAV